MLKPITKGQAIKNKAQLLRFALVGGINTALDFGLLFGLRALGLPVELANIASTGAAFIFSFFANKKYTFRAQGGNLLRQMLLFIIVTLFGLWVLQTLVISLTLPLLETSLGSSTALFVAKLLATGVSLVWNYVLYSTIVFRTSA